MKTKTLLLLLFGLWTGMAVAQEITVKGKVIDAETGEAIAGANVFLKDNPAKGTATDITGQFKLTGVPANAIIVIFGI